MNRLTFIVAAFLLTAGLTSCGGDAEKPLTPLSEAELLEYKELQKEIAPKLKRAKEYKAAEERVKNAEKGYIENYIKLIRFSLYKTDQFSDGLARLCYHRRGGIKNNGDEVVSKLELSVTINDSGTGEKITEWKTMLVDANDRFLRETKDKELRSAVIALRGRKPPIDPDRSYALSQNQRRCMKDVYFDWDEESIKWELSDIELRPQLKEYRLSDVIDDDFFRMKELQRRGKHFDQISEPLDEK